MRVRSAHRISSISNTAGNVSISTVTFIVPGGSDSVVSICAEHVVPERRFAMALHFRQIEVRTAIARVQRARVVEREETEIEQRARHRLAVDHEMLFRQMPAARAHHQHRGIGLDLVVLALGRCVVDRAGDRVAKIELAVDEAVATSARSNPRNPP